MLNITITEQTPHNMLRAIRAACNELLGETHADLTTQAAQHNSRANGLHAAASAETDKAAACLTAANEALALKQAFDQAVEKTGDAIVAKLLTDAPLAYQGSVTGTGTIETPPQNIPKSEITPAVEMDSAGAEWNPELHASTKAKNQDGTWKKRRGAGQNVAEIVEKQEQQLGIAQTPSLPPLPPAPPAAPLVTMNDIYALVANGKALLNDVIAAAQAMGFADVGAFSRDATPEQRAQLLDQLTKEVA